VALTRDDGMPAACAANFDNLQTVPKQKLGKRITTLSAVRLAEATAVLSFALALGEE
jgi:mRNA-degrading endonuclease toxin of MazEF toxin-antitoxin module